MNLFGLVEEKDWRYRFFFFFFFCCGLLVVVVVVAAAAAVAVADCRSGCGWCYENFLGVRYIILL